MQVTITHISGLRQGERETFTGFPIIIGRAPGSDLRLAANDTRASARHAEVMVEGDSLVLRDLNSTNGTYMNGRRVERVKLAAGDIVEFGIDGPRLRFEYAQAEKPVAAPPAAVSPAPVHPVIAPPPLVIQPGPAQQSPQFEIANQAGAKLAVAPPSLSSSPSQSAMPMAIEEREFPYRNRLKFVLLGVGAALFIASILLFIQQVLIWTVPVGLIGIFLVIMSWSCWRINITANNQGIYYQGILRSKMIRWDDVTELRAFRSRTRLLTHIVYIVQGRNGEIVFAPQDYVNGFDLAALISRRVRLNW